MLTEKIPLILAIVSFVLLLGTFLAWSWESKLPRQKPLPSEWALAARPIFNADERHVYRLLRQALPNHIVLTKLPLVRLCQPSDPRELRYWYELLGPVHIGFAVCSSSGRVLAAIDIDSRHGRPRRSLHIKRKALAACGVRYLRCPADRVPSPAELQLLVAGKPLGDAPASVEPALIAPEVQSKSLWRDSGFARDSVFGVGRDVRGAEAADGPVSSTPPRAQGKDDDDVVGGVVVGWVPPPNPAHR